MQPLKQHLNAEELARQLSALQNLFKDNCEEGHYSSDVSNFDVRKMYSINEIDKAMTEWRGSMTEMYENILSIAWQIIPDRFPWVELRVQVKILFDLQIYNLAVVAEVK